jgi:membrane-associated phospholipid phosphatase
MKPELLQAISDLGDLAVLLPLSLALTLTLWRFESRRAATGFAAALLACLSLMFLLKLAFASCGLAWHSSIRSPSGHAGLSTLVYGACAAVARTHATRRWRPALIPAGLLLLSAIAVSRVLLHYHSTAEVAIGIAVGAAMLTAFARDYGNQTPHPPVKLQVLLALCSLAIGLGFGVRLQAESWVLGLGLELRQHGGPCGIAADPERDGKRAPTRARRTEAQIAVDAVMR